MTATEIITITVSVAAFVISILAIVLQYSGRDDMQFKVTDISLVVLEKMSGKPRTAAVTLNFAAYNLGNRQIAIENMALKLDEGNYRKLERLDSYACGTNGSRFVGPISKKNYGKLSIPPLVISKENLHAEELVFDLFLFEREKTLVEIEGLLCFEVRFSNSKGIVKTVSKPIAITQVSINRDTDDIVINFDTSKFTEINSLNKVF